jgi:hypothetical protein
LRVSSERHREEGKDKRHAENSNFAFRISDLRCYLRICFAV